jgi:hypothetical protein
MMKVKYMNLAILFFIFKFSHFLATENLQKHFFFEVLIFQIFVFWREISPVKKKNTDADRWQIRSKREIR